MLSTKENLPVNLSNVKKVKPFGDRVLIEELPEENKSTGGIILVKNKKTMCRRGKVVAVGDGRVNEKGVREPIDLKPGDLVVFSYLSAVNVKYNDKVLKIVTSPNVFVVVEE